MTAAVITPTTPSASPSLIRPGGRRRLEPVQRLGGGDKVHKTLKARELWDQIAYAAWRCADPGMQFDTTINDWHTCPNSGRINASNPCVTGDTRVLTPGGIWRRIDQMIHLPARVVTNLDGQDIHVTVGAFPTGTRDVYDDAYYEAFFKANRAVMERRLAESASAVAAMRSGTSKVTDPS